jgi:hypothetical protein
MAHWVGPIRGLKLLFMGRFHLVDFAAHFQKGFRNHIVAIDEVPALVDSFKHYGCYSTYFFFSDEVLTYMSAQPGGAAPSIAGYEGRVWAPYLPLDLDHPELVPAQEAAKRLVDCFWRSGRSIKTRYRFILAALKDFIFCSTPGCSAASHRRKICL